MVRKVNFKKNPLTLVGREIKSDVLAFNFKVITKDLSEKNLSDFEGKIKIIHSFPSLDTQVCDLQVKEFNKKASSISKDIKILGISKDLPFAQDRFCKSSHIDNETILSDYKTSSYGLNYGLLIKELNLLARSVIIIDKSNYIRYVQIADEITSSLDFKDLFINLDNIIKNPITIKEKKLIPNQCLPCEGKVSSLSQEEINKKLKSLDKWDLLENTLVKKIKFKDFIEAKYFLDLLSIISEEQGHHPIFNLNYNVLTITLFTHAVKGISENDFIMAKIIDQIKS
jgi:thiol peroxidase